MSHRHLYRRLPPSSVGLFSKSKQNRKITPLNPVVNSKPIRLIPQHLTDYHNINYVILYL